MTEQDVGVPLLQILSGGTATTEENSWAFEFERSEEGDEFKLDELWEADAKLLGRITYEGFAAAWPEREDEAGFAKKMNEMPKYVVSSTLVEPEWQSTTVLGGDLGAGKRLFPEGTAKKPLTLTESKTVGDGVSILRYEPSRASRRR